MCTQYEKCISEVMPILEQYDSDKKVEFLGYGAEVDGKFPPYFTISQYSPECYGADGMLSAYRDNMHRFKPGDMSQARGGDKEWRAHNHRYYCDDFYQIVNYVCDVTEKEMREEAPPGSGRFPPRYFILVVILDGDSFDTEGTRRALIRASALPVSIVLVGIGDSYFPNLVAYDADKQPMQTSERVSAMRDCVQFVRFNDFVAEEGKVNKRKLSDEVLKEIPGQVEGFLGMYGIRFNGEVCVRKDKKHRDRRHKYFATSLANQENDANSLKILESKQKYREERKKEKEVKALEKKKRELERKEKIDNIMSAAAAQNASDVPAKK